MDQQTLRRTTTMWAGLASTTIAAAVTLVLCLTGLPSALTVPVLAVLMAVMVGGVVTDIVVRRRWRRATRKQRAWLSGLDEDLPLYRARVEDRERTLFGVESRWYRPLGTLFLVGLSAAIVPFSLLLPLAPEEPVDALVSGWVALSLLITIALVFRTVQAARKDSHGLTFPAPAPAAEPAPQPYVAPASPDEIRQERIEKYLVLEDEEEVSPEVQLAREIDRLTKLLDDPDMPRPSIPVPAAWVEPEAAEPEAADPGDVASGAAEASAPAEAPPTEVVTEAHDARAAVDDEPAAEKSERESELSKFSKFFHAA